MAEPVNYLIGRGETLVQPIDLNTGGGQKSHPYTFEDAYEALLPQLRSVAASIEALPTLACPNDEAVVAVTLHPAYLAKSYHPTRFLRDLGLRQVGSREERVLPRKWTQKKAPIEPLVAPELFIAGDRKRLSRLPELLAQSVGEAVREDFRRFESIRPLGSERIKQVAGDDEAPPLEIVLHADVEKNWGGEVIEGFYRWCRQLDFVPETDHRQQVGGLAFLGMHVPRDVIESLAEFSFLRAVRRMPRLSFREVELRASETGQTFAIDIPTDASAVEDISVAIFDGGLPDDHPFGGLVNVKDVPGIGDPVPAAVRHGVQVTSALLYGPLTSGSTPIQPFSKVDHWRVIDDEGDDFELMTALERIIGTLDQSQYDFVSLSLGPNEAMIDDDVHVWTSKLDRFASSGSCLLISAAGNNGHFEVPVLHRVQPPSDGVNVLAVGAADAQGTTWARADYSARGPGRSPGMVKPDIVAFGGCDEEPFFAIDEAGLARGTKGTSFSAPVAARLGVGLKALFGPQLTPTAIKALLIHHARDDNHPQTDVGWGRVPGDIDGLSICGSDEATIVYQGALEPSRFRRFPLPVPADGFSSRVEVRATFVAATAVDPEDAITYTRTGVGITFRPKTIGHPGYTIVNGEQRERAVHASGGFFGNSAIFKNEQALRDDAHRWESVKKAKKRFNPGTLEQPVFDVEHLARSNGQGAIRSDSVNYALIVTLHERGATDLYNRVIRSYAGRLTAMVPQIEIQVRTRA